MCRKQKWGGGYMEDWGTVSSCGRAPPRGHSWERQMAFYQTEGGCVFCCWCNGGYNQSLRVED